MVHRLGWLLVTAAFAVSCQDVTSSSDCPRSGSQGHSASSSARSASGKGGSSGAGGSAGEASDAGPPDTTGDGSSGRCPDAADAAPVGNPVLLENSLPGTTAWALSNPADNHEIEGYASKASVAPGEDVTLYVNVGKDGAAHWELYRLGYYGGLGGRFVSSGAPAPIHGQASCPVSPDTGLVQCSWEPFAQVRFAPSLVSGYYVFRLIRDDGFDTYVPVIVREPTARAPLLVQASITTWQAYNQWGGSSLYKNNLPSTAGFSAKRAYQVSFDRPYQADRGFAGSGDLFVYEIYMARWLESRGYDVAYTTNIDIDRDPDVLLGRKLFMDVGHDEYWPMKERDAAERARDRGVSLAFFSGNSAYWRVRLDASATTGERRIVTCYKDSSLDPHGGGEATVKFRDPEIDRPENALMGQMYELFTRMDGFPLVVTNPDHWAYAGTHVVAGDAISHVVGDEWDHVFANHHSPGGLEVLAHSDAFGAYGSDVPADVTVYYPTPESFVFSAGTRQWSWGLGKPDYQDLRIERVTENVLARAGLVATLTPRVILPLTSADLGTAAHVSVVAGTGSPGYLDGAANTALFEAPSGVAADAAGNIYVTDTRNQRVRKIAVDGTVTTLAGSGPTGITTNFHYKDGPGDHAQFGVPTGIAVGPDGIVYVSDSHNNVIRAIAPDGTVSRYAGTGDVGNTDATYPPSASFAYPRGLAFAPDGSLHVADAYNNLIRRIGKDGVTTVANCGVEVTAVAFGPDGTEYALTTNGSVSIVQGGKLVPIVDTDGAAGDAVGAGATARMRPADGLVVDGQFLIVSDSANYKVRRVALSSDHTVTTLVGDGRAGVEVGTGATTHVVNPRGIALTPTGYIVADSGNHRILRIDR